MEQEPLVWVMTDARHTESFLTVVVHVIMHSHDKAETLRQSGVCLDAHINTIGRVKWRR